MRFFIFLVATVLYFAGPVAAFAAGAEMVTVKTKRGVSQSFLLVVPDNPKAGVILFNGGNGALALSGSGEIKSGGTIFFSRIYKTFADHGLMVALVDAPSDMKELGASERVSDNHANDMVAVIAHMKKKADVPIWLAGTSLGSISAASVGIKKQKLVAGMVLTSSVTRPGEKPELKKFHEKYPDGVLSLNLDKFKRPALVVSHERDGCKASPPEDAANLKTKLSASPRVGLVLLTGGKAAKSDPCEGLSQHGFFGIETNAVKAIADFIL